MKLFAISVLIVWAESRSTRTLHYPTFIYSDDRINAEQFARTQAEESPYDLTGATMSFSTLEITKDDLHGFLQRV